MSDIEATTDFEVSGTPAEAWKALAELRVGRVEGDDWWLPGWECRCRTVEVEPDERLVVRKAVEPCAGTLITVTFEHANTGTRIRVVQSGFDPAFVDFAGESFWIHADHIYADLQMYFEAGIIAQRAWLPWTMLGCDARTASCGIEVTQVTDDSWASRLGLEPGDLLLTTGGAPLFSMRDFVTVQRMTQPGSDLSATWVRAGHRRQGVATT